MIYLEPFKKGNIFILQARVSIDDLDGLEDVEQCVLYYNQAVILYHLQQHQSALKIMNKVFTFIEPMGKLKLLICSSAY